MLDMRKHLIHRPYVGHAVWLAAGGAASDYLVILSLSQLICIKIRDKKIL